MSIEVAFKIACLNFQNKVSGGLHRLYRALLSDGSAVDKLFGRAELDWFLVAGTDVVLDHENGEVSIVA